MKHHLNISKEDSNYILLEKIFKIIGSIKSKGIMASKDVKKILFEKINDWKLYEANTGKIEDFFKLCKSGLSLKKLHKYTPESAKKPQY